MAEGDFDEELGGEQQADDEPLTPGTISGERGKFGRVAREDDRGGEIIDGGEQDRRPQGGEIEGDRAERQPRRTVGNNTTMSCVMDNVFICNVLLRSLTHGSF